MHFTQLRCLSDWRLDRLLALVAIGKARSALLSLEQILIALSDIIVQLELTDPMNLLLHVFGFNYVLREDGLAEVMAQQVASMGDL